MRVIVEFWRWPFDPASMLKISPVERPISARTANLGCVLRGIELARAFQLLDSRPSPSLSSAKAIAADCPGAGRRLEQALNHQSSAKLLMRLFEGDFVFGRDEKQLCDILPIWANLMAHREHGQNNQSGATRRVAARVARQTYPGYERESGTQWPDIALDPAEALLFAFAVLRALDKAGFEIVPKKGSA